MVLLGNVWVMLRFLRKALSDSCSPVFSPEIQHPGHVVGGDQAPGQDHTCPGAWVPGADTCAVSLHVSAEASLRDEDVLLVSGDGGGLRHVVVTLAGAPGPGNWDDDVVEVDTSWKYVEGQI